MLYSTPIFTGFADATPTLKKALLAGDDIFHDDIFQKFESVNRIQYGGRRRTPRQQRQRSKGDFLYFIVLFRGR